MAEIKENEEKVEEALETGPDEGELQFPINQELMDAAARAKEEWRVVRDRLAKIEEHRENVSEVVHQRVLTDYKARIKVVTDAVLEEKKAIDAELASLKETQGNIVKELEGHRHTLEEIKFRNTLGEFSEEEYQEKAREEQDKISKFETVLSAVNSNIHRYEALFEDEPDLFAAEEPPPAGGAEAAGEVSGLTPISPTSEPLTDESGYVIEEGEPDYFEDTEPDRTSPAIGAAASEGVEAAQASGARIVVINGEDAGMAFMLKGTMSFGRAESSTVTIRDAKVSRQHAQIQQQGNEYILVDLNSSNGTFVNGERIEEHVLSNGDEIEIGDCIMQFQM
jgi:sulfur carrier protein ThiS